MKHPFLPKGSIDDWDALPLFQDNTEGMEENCVVIGCTRKGVEYHHSAPRSVFQEESSDWPIYPICLYHHRRWHDMTGVAVGGKKHD
jgi:hypothetical protein